MRDQNDPVGAQERANVAKAKWTVFHEGNILPVTNLYGSDGEEIDNPMHASTVVAFDSDADNWVTITGIEPGELWSRRNADSPQYQH